MRDSTHVSVRSTLAAYLGVDPTRVKPEQQLRGDWGLGPRERNGLAFRLEQVQGVSIRPHDLEDIQTIDELIDLVRERRRDHERRRDQLKRAA